MKRVFVISLAAAVVAASLIAPAQAKKKKPRKPPAPVPVQADATYFLRRDGDCAEESGRFLSLVDAEDVDTLSCGNNYYGVIDQVEEQPAIRYATRAADGVPVTLDATKDITGLVGVKSQSAQGQAIRIGAGEANLHVELEGVTAAGETVMIATGDTEYQVTPGDLSQIYEVEFTLKPDVAFDKVSFTALTLSLKNTGNSVNHGYYTTDNPASYFKMGTWQ